MAQRKPPTPAKKSAARPAAGGPNRPQGSRGPAGRPPNRKPGKSIVNQKQTPWGLIASVAVVVVFAAAIVVYLVVHNSGGKNNMPSTKAADKTYEQPEVPAAKAIKGIQWHVITQHEHVTTTVKYSTSPPTGGNHNGIWADCTGTVYPTQIANENAVHMLEHGAIWITYNPKTISAADLTKLKTYVDGVSWMAMSPYAGLKTPISLQAWNYQLFVNSANDPRIGQFIDALQHKKASTPEYGASCSDPSFNAKQSYPGHPFNG